MAFQGALNAALVFIVLDLLIGTLSDGVFSVIYINLFLLFLQIILIVALASSLYLMLSRTLLFQAGQFAVLLKRFKYPFLLIFAYFILTVAVRVLRFLDALQGGTLESIYYSTSYYAPVFAIMKLFGILSYSSVLISASKLSNPNYYLNSG